MIYKYPLEITDKQRILIGDKTAHPLSVAEQNGKLVMWVRHEYDHVFEREQAVVVEIIGTGNPENAAGKFIGTVVMSNGLVWHIFATVEDA